MKSSLSLSTMALGLALAVSAQAQPAWTQEYVSPTKDGDCAGLPAALNTGFTTTRVVSQALFGSIAPIRVLKMAFWLQPGAQYNDIYMIEKGTGGSARVLYYNGVTNALSHIGTITGVSHGGGGVAEQGLLGITLNPVTFGTDNYLYLAYTVGTGGASASAGMRIARYKIDPTTKVIDMASQKILLHVPMGQSGRWHTAGAMAMDNFGNLYITIADNEALAMGPGNTADLRGGILRIRPDDSERGYSIPAGNFGEYWAQVWQDSGLTARATAYRDTSIVKPQIYIKGSRNPYSLSVDRHRLGWIAWSECGPDNQRNEEHNFSTKPAFGGWPFWAGNAVRQQSKAGSYDEPNEVTNWATFNPASMTTQVPYNNHGPATGYDTLPPMHQPMHYYTNPSCAVGGAPIIRYNGTISNPKKMPPHLDNVVMMADFNTTATTNIWAKKIDTATGQPVGSATQVFTMAKTGRPNTSNMVDFQQGRDGSLYAIDWGTGCCSENSNASNNGIVRIEYNGTCQDPGLTVSVANPKTPIQGKVSWFRVDKSQISLQDDGSGRISGGSHSIQILDVNGRVVKTFKGQGAQTYAMPSLEAGKIYVLRAVTPVGTMARTFSNI